MHPYSNKGIAIGPILFIIAVLAVLVGAIASGNSGFSNTTAEATKTRATPIIQQGVNFKMALETVMTQGAAEEDVIVSTNFTLGNGTLALFSPTGGTLIPQIPPREATGTGASWVFADNQNMEGLGTSGSGDVVAYLRIANAAMCRTINEIIFSVGAAQVTTLPTITVTVVDNAVTAEDGVIDVANTFGTAGVSSVSGRMQACVADSESTPNYWYYQVLRAN